MVTISDSSDIIDKAADQVPFSLSTLKKLGTGFNLNSLIATVNLSGDKRPKFAKNYIAFASGLVKPHEVIPPRDMLSDLDNVTDYKVQLGINASRTAASTSTLYYFLAERLPQAGLGKLSGITVDDAGNISFDSRDSSHIPDAASPLMVAKYNVEKRAANPNWYKAMESAPPATIQRETLYVLANINKSFFDSQMLMERQIALLAIISLAQNEIHQKDALKSDAAAIDRSRAVQGMPRFNKQQ